jgi:hypothetical protein
MNRQQAIEQALMKCNSLDMGDCVEIPLAQWEAVEEALALPDDTAERVAWINVEKRVLEFAGIIEWNTPTTVHMPKIPLYTHPPKDTAERDALAAKMNDEVNLYGRLTIKTILALYAYLTRDHIPDTGKKV